MTDETTETRSADAHELELTSAVIEAARRLIVQRLADPDCAEIRDAVEAGKATFSLEVQFPSRALRGWVYWPAALGDEPQELFRLVPTRYTEMDLH